MKFQCSFSENISSVVFLSSYFKIFSQAFLKFISMKPDAFKKYFKVIQINNKINGNTGEAKDLQLWECVSSVLN